MKRFKDILCVVKTETACKAALECAVTLAENNQASLTVVDVVELVIADIGRKEGGPRVADLQAALVSEHTQDMEILIAPYRTRVDIKTKVLIGVPFLETVREVLRNGHDLVVTVPETQDWLYRLFGSNDMHLLRKCPCPVWLTKAQMSKSYRRILASVDVSDACSQTELESQYVLNRQILEMASSLALSEFAELHVAHVWHAIGETALGGAFMHTSKEKVVAYVEQVRQDSESSLDGLICEVTNKLGKGVKDYLKPRTHLMKGRASEEIPVLIKRVEADLVVMGTVARTGISGFIMGNTAETILNQLDCSVLAVKPPGFVTPVRLEE